MDSARSEGLPEHLRPDQRARPAPGGSPAEEGADAARPGRTRPGGGAPAASEPPVSLKILVAGGFGAGKTTLVGAVSEIRPLRTEERLTEAGRPVDDLTGVEGKATTTVAMDFGRIDLRPGLALYLFGTPGQDRFWFLWDELAVGAIGAVVLADTRRLPGCFPAVDYFERRGIPFVVAVNCFDGARRYPPDEVREALDLDPGIPVVLCDARSRGSSRDVLITLVEHALAQRGPGTGPSGRAAVPALSGGGPAGG